MNSNPALNISRDDSGIRPGVPIFQARVQYSEVDSRFGGRLRKFQPGVDYLEAGLENLEPGYENFEPGLETFATDGTAYGRGSNHQPPPVPLLSVFHLCKFFLPKQPMVMLPMAGHSSLP